MQSRENPPVAAALAASDTNWAKSWGPALLAWCLLIAGLAFVFGHAFWCMWMYHWFPAWGRSGLGLYDRLVEGDSYYTHAPIVPLAALGIAYVLIRKTKIAIRPRPIIGGLVLAASLLIQLTASLVGVQFVQGFAFIGVVVGLVLVIWGGGALRRLWFPILLLFFMMPLPPIAIAQLNFRLKMLAADWGVALSHVLGIPSARSGAQLFIGHDKQMVVGNVCSGLRTLISMLGFGVVYAYVCKLRGWWRAGIFAAVLPVAVVSNCMRITALIVMAYATDVKTATGSFHDITGMLLFVLAFVLMFAIEHVILRVRALLGKPAKVEGILGGASLNDDPGQVRRVIQAPASWPGAVAVVLIALSAAGIYHISRIDRNSAAKPVMRGAIPVALKVGEEQYTSIDTELDETTLGILRTDDYVMRRYESTISAPIELCITCSRGSRRGTHPPDVCIEGDGNVIIAKGDVSVPGADGHSPVPCRELVVQKGQDLEYFLYTYLCGESYTSNWYWQQVAILGSKVLGDDTSGALIRISMPVEDGDLAATRKQSRDFMQALIPQVNAAVAKADEDSEPGQRAGVSSNN